MRIRSLVSSTITLIKLIEPKTTRYYSRLSKQGLPSQKHPASQARDEAAPTAPTDPLGPSASRNRAPLKRTFRQIRGVHLRKTHPVILRQVKSGPKHLKPQRSKRPRPTKSFKPPKRLSKPAKQAKDKAESIVKSSVILSSASNPPGPSNSTDPNHPSETTFTLTKLPLQAPFIRHHHSVLRIQKIIPQKNRRFQKIPSGPKIQHTTTKAAEAEAEPKPIRKSRRKRGFTLRRIDPFFAPSHPKHTLISQYQRLTPSATIRTHLITPDPRKITVNISYRPPQSSLDLGETHTASKAVAKAKGGKMSDPTQNPSQIHGHATYVAGAAKEALGFASGAEDKEYAVKEMRAAKEQAEGDPAKNETVGKIEEKLGSATGCEGMVGEGKERQG